MTESTSHDGALEPFPARRQLIVTRTWLWQPWRAVDSPRVAPSAAATTGSVRSPHPGESNSRACAH